MNVPRVHYEIQFVTKLHDYVKHFIIFVFYNCNYISFKLTLKKYRYNDICMYNLIVLFVFFLNIISYVTQMIT